MLYKDTYRLKELEGNDFPFVKKLLWSVFQKKVTVAELKHKYDASHLGLDNVSTIAYKKEIPVAFYGAILQKFKKENEEIIIAQACDSATLENHQGKGLHYQLARLSYKNMQKQKVSCVYAFMNENSFESTKKLGWNSYFNMQRFHIKTNTLPIAKILNKLNWNAVYSLGFKNNDATSTFEKFMNQNQKKYTQVIDSKSIKHINKTNYIIELENCVFWIKIERIIHIGLCYASSEISLLRAIKKLKQKAFFLGISEILFQVDPKSNISKQLTTIVAPKQSWHVGYLSFDNNIDLKDFIFNYSDLDTF